MSIVDMLVIAGLVAIGVAFAGWLMWAGIKNARAQPFDVVFDDGENDDPEARSNFLKVLRHAKRKLIVHDDGDNMQASIYNEADVIEAVRRQLDGNPKLVVMCLFNVRENLKMVERLSGLERFQVKYRRWFWARPAFDVHYKIAMTGRLATFPTTKEEPRSGALRYGTV